MSVFENPETPQLKLVSEWNVGFKEKNLDILAKSLHKDFRRYTYPRSLGQPVQTKEEWFGHLAKVIDITSEFEQTLHSVIEAPGKVIIHATNEAKNPHGVKTLRESIYIIHVTDKDGDLKIKQIEEFTDSKTYLEVIKSFEAMKANK